MKPEELFKLQFNLEGKAFDPQGYIFQFKKVEGETLPRLCLMDYGNEIKLYLARGLDPALEAELRQLAPEILRHDQERIKAILARQEPCREEGPFVTYTFPSLLDQGDDHDIIAFTEPHHPLLTAFNHGFDGWVGVTVFGLKQQGRLVAACVSSRESEAAGEAWVFTLPEERGRGYAKRVVLAWQRDLKRRGKVPFYSHERANAASAGLARSLGLRQIYVQINYL